jgi:hypothetical protein
VRTTERFLQTRAFWVDGEQKKPKPSAMVEAALCGAPLPPLLDYAALAAAVKGRDERKERALDSGGKGTGAVLSLFNLTPPSLS